MLSFFLKQGSRRTDVRLGGIISVKQILIIR